jgi:hypothetical protein
MVTRMYPAIAIAGQQLNAEQALVDGALDSQGLPTSQAL